MPLTEEVTIEAGTKGEGFTPVPAGIYQVVVSDVEKVDGTDYTTKQPVKQLQFKTTIVEDGDEQGKRIMVWAGIKWFNGVSQKGVSMSPSKLYSFAKAIYGYYHKKVDLSVIELSDINMNFLNDLIGKQLMLVVDERDGKNRVTGFSAIKQEIHVPENKENVDESVEPDDIPF